MLVYLCPPLVALSLFAGRMDRGGHGPASQPRGLPFFACKRNQVSGTREGRSRLTKETLICVLALITLRLERSDRNATAAGERGPSQGAVESGSGQEDAVPVGTVRVVGKLFSGALTNTHV